MPYERFLDKSRIPDEDALSSALGPAKALWADTHAYIQSHYDISSETIYITKQYGWWFRYRRGKKTLCYLFPEAGAFTVLIVLGSAEAERAESMRDRLNDAVRRVMETTEQLHDGRWMWFRVTDASDALSFQALLAAKVKPKLGV